jgi:dihydrodipicolinate synthase/N-acetylneuraminate lyase
MKVKGMASGSVRLPLVEVTDAAKATIEKALKESKIN